MIVFCVGHLKWWTWLIVITFNTILPATSLSVQRSDCSQFCIFIELGADDYLSVESGVRSWTNFRSRCPQHGNTDFVFHFDSKRALPLFPPNLLYPLSVSDGHTLTQKLNNIYFIAISKTIYTLLVTQIFWLNLLGTASPSRALFVSFLFLFAAALS